MCRDWIYHKTDEDEVIEIVYKALVRREGLNLLNFRESNGRLYSYSYSHDTFSYESVADTCYPQK